MQLQTQEHLGTLSQTVEDPSESVELRDGRTFNTDELNKHQMAPEVQNQAERRLALANFSVSG